MAFPPIPPGLSLRRRAVAVLSLALPAAAARAEAMPTIGGTGSAIGLLQVLADAYAQAGGSPWRILPSLGSEGGLRAFAAGRLDIALTLHEAPVTGFAVQRLVLGRTPVLIATRGGDPPRGLDSAQAVRMLCGEQAAWPDGTPARPVLRAPREREWLALPASAEAIARMGGGTVRRAGQVVGATAQENADALAAMPGSLGVITLGQILTERPNIQPVALDGVLPGLAALRAGTWPHAVTLHATARAEASAQVQAAMAFLGSSAAAARMEPLGYDPGARPA